MRLIDKRQKVRERVTGRLSDGSDRVVEAVTEWVAVVADAVGNIHELAFDHDPADDEMLARLPRARLLEGSTKAALEDVMRERFGDWKRWKETRVEAQARGEGAGVITALTNAEDSAWGSYRSAIIAWRAAS